jgi:oligopeptide transport system substrate-binding protein
MKKVLLLVSALVLTMTLSACKKDLECPEGQVEKDGACVETVPDGDVLYYDEDATYNLYTSGVTDINPYSQTMASSSDIFAYITDSLYTGDYDWDKAIAEGLATEEGDFSGGASKLPYMRTPAMATSEPVDVLGDGTVWEITIRQDLEFEDGTAIDAETFEWSWSQLLDPDQLNIRASGLYDETSLPVANAEAYYKQKSPDTDDNGFINYEIDGVTYNTDNAYYGAVIGYPTWHIYYPEAPYDKLIGPEYTAEDGTVLAAGQRAFVEYWDWTGKQGYVLVDELDNAFKVNADGDLIAPYEGWTLDGVAVAVATADNKAVGYAGALPAFMNEAGDIPLLDEAGVPIGGVTTDYDQVVVEWDTVGIKAKSEYVLEITLAKAKTAWDVKGQLMSGVTGVVHKASYEAGMNDAKTSTTYGTIENQLVSYGPYNMTTWQADTIFIFDKNDDFYMADDYRINHIRYEFIEDQSVAVEEFKLGNLDLTGASGDYYDDFQYAPNLKLTPTTTFFRFAFNVEGSDTYEANPILGYKDFRHAFYYAIDREEFVTSVRAPGYATQGFLGPKYTSTEYNAGSYRSSSEGQAVYNAFSSDTAGFNPVEAKKLFDKAYDALVADATAGVSEGDVVSIEYKYYDVETNQKVADWVESTVEAIFNQGETTPIFDLTLAPVSSDALDAAWDGGHFDMTFGGWQGIDFNAPSMLGQVYNSADLKTMLEIGFDTENAQITVKLEGTYTALSAWVAAYDATTATDAEADAYDAWVAALAKFDATTKELSCTYNELFKLAYGAFYNVNDINYAGKTDDFNAISAALEGVLLDQMIAIPLFTSVGATVYSNRIVIEANEFHPWMGWGGLKYRYIATEK